MKHVPANTPGIWKARMDGSDIFQMIPNVVAILLTVDYSSQLLFWVEVRMEGYQISHSDLNGRGVDKTIDLKYPPRQLRVAGSRLFWLDEHAFTKTTLVSCEKRGANKKRFHELKYKAEGDETVDFLIISPTVDGFQRAVDDGYCIAGALCSHMCVAYFPNYMQCLCPLRYRLESDGWTCGEKCRTKALNSEFESH